MPTNFRSKTPATHRNDNFERRLRETMDTESDPEMFTPNSAGAEELTDYVENFPLVKEFGQTNMKSTRGRRGSQSGRGRDQD